MWSISHYLLLLQQKHSPRVSPLCQGSNPNHVSRDILLRFHRHNKALEPRRTSKVEICTLELSQYLAFGRRKSYMWFEVELRWWYERFDCREYDEVLNKLG